MALCISMANAQKCLRRGKLDYDPGGRAGVTVICKKCIVGGRVQGVFYRATVAQRARELGVTGHAINLPDGRVEVLARGPQDAVQTLIDFLWTGSSASRVTSVDVADVTLEGAAHRLTGFRTG